MLKERPLMTRPVPRMRDGVKARVNLLRMRKRLPRVKRTSVWHEMWRKIRVNEKRNNNDFKKEEEKKVC